MKLIKPVQMHSESVTFVERAPRTAVQFLRGEEGTAIMHRTVQGRMKFSTCVIDFEDQQIILGEKIDQIEFEADIYHGVLPLKNDHGSSEVECWVERIEKKK